jgi:hypothetical protein
VSGQHLPGMGALPVCVCVCVCVCVPGRTACKSVCMHSSLSVYAQQSECVTSVSTVVTGEVRHVVGMI